MFDDTWKWAGEFRKTQKNIGALSYQISSEIVKLLDDVSYQLSNSSFSTDAIAYRFRHRLVAIHPFPNGNGRHSRLITDNLLTFVGEEKFTWGKINLMSNSKTRDNYIRALAAADKQDYSKLADFVRS